MAMGPSMEEVVLIDAAKKAGLEELQLYLDASGGIASAKFAGERPLITAFVLMHDARLLLLCSTAKGTGLSGLEADWRHRSCRGTHEVRLLTVVR